MPLRENAERLHVPCAVAETLTLLLEPSIRSKFNTSPLLQTLWSLTPSPKCVVVSLRRLSSQTVMDRCFHSLHWPSNTRSAYLQSNSISLLGSRCTKGMCCVRYVSSRMRTYASSARLDLVSIKSKTQNIFCKLRSTFRLNRFLEHQPSPL